MKTILFILFFFSFIPFTNAQNWIWASSTTGSIYSDEGVCVATDKLGNSYLGGEFASPQMTFGSITINQTPFCGTSFIVKYDAAGNPLWAKSIGCGGVYGISADTLGNVYITGDYLGSANLGAHSLSNNGNGDFFVAKIDPNGNYLWSATATGNTGDRGNDVVVSPSGDVYVAGIFTSSSLNFGITTLTNSSQGWGDIFIAKYNAGGNLVWVKQAGGVTDDMVYSIAADLQNNIFITGYFTGSSTFGNHTLSSNGMNDVYLAEMDSAGTFLWSESFGGLYNDISYAVATSANGEAVFTGSFVSPSITIGNQTFTNPGQNSDGFIAKTDPAGNIIWANGISGNNMESGYGVDVASNGEIAFSGGSGSASMTYNSSSYAFPLNSIDPSFLFRLDSSGNVICHQELASGGDDQNSVAFMNGGDIVLGGDFMVDPFIFDSDTLTLDSLEDVFIARYHGNCSPEGVTGLINSSRYEIYPDPSNGIFIIHVPANNFPLHVNIYDTFGQFVYGEDLKSSESIIDLNKNAAGMYFYTITDNGKFLAGGKIIKQ